MTTSKKSAKPVSTRSATEPKPFSSPNYHKNSDRCGGNTTPCACCGKPVNDPWQFAVQVVDGGAWYATAGQAAGTEKVDSAGDMGCFPVGSACAKKLKAAGVHVFDWK